MGMLICKKCNVAVEGECCPVCGSMQFASMTPEAKEMSVFVGEQSGYYLARWSKSGFHRSGFLTWNWPAFLFGVSWMAYRKMFGWAIFFVALELCFDWVIRALVPKAAAITFHLAVIATISLAGNFLYYRHVRKKIEVLKKTVSEDKLNFALPRAGGVSGFAVVICILVRLAAIWHIDYYLGL